MSDNQKLYQERKTRVDTAIAMGQPDRVPNVTIIGSFPYHEYGVTMAESMTDYEKCNEAIRKFYTDFPQLDNGAGLGFTLSAKALEAFKVKCVRWPGESGGLDDDNTLQYLEYPTLLDDEYDEFFNDPAGFAIRKYLPRLFEIFEPLANLDYAAMCGGIYMAPMMSFTSPEMLDTCRALLKAADEMAILQEAAARSDQMVRDMGFPSIFGGASATAFDMLGDGLRGTFGLMPDLIEQPENVTRACEIFVEKHIEQSLGFSKMTNSRYAWVMLHKGFDNFISDEAYATYYWPYLQRWILAMIDNGITPVVYTEGRYTSRLKFLRDVPKGKVIYHFEEVDIAECKKQLGDVACIMGCFPMMTLTNGTTQQIKDKVKETLDILAPGGGYLFGTGHGVEMCPRGNLETMFETVETYGKY